MDRFLLAIFDATNAILAVMALIFTMTLLKRSGELTALLGAGLPHGRILRPMLIAALVVLIVAVGNREFLMPNWQDQLGAKTQDLSGELTRAMQPCYDRMTGIQYHGKGVIVLKKEIASPALMIRSDMPGIGEQLTGQRAQLLPASEQHPAGFLIDGVTRPENIDEIKSTGFHDQTYLFTSADNDWLGPKQCFVASHIDFDQLRTGSNWKRLASTGQLVRRVRNPSVYSGPDTEVTLHSRFVRPWLDVSLILLGLPLVVTRVDKNVFLVAGWGLGLIAFFFLIKTIFTTLGSSETLVSPAIAAWGPLVVFGPMGYSRLLASYRI